MGDAQNRHFNAIVHEDSQDAYIYVTDASGRRVAYMDTRYAIHSVGRAPREIAMPDDAEDVGSNRCVSIHRTSGPGEGEKSGCCAWVKSIDAGTKSNEYAVNFLHVCSSGSHHLLATATPDCT